ncbi:MAG TPA: glycosyltransferase family 4 protein [Gemmatimonadaceae bacterium]|nr:glycosyltransferase family 4 protein [Gemmatimonadaceae bacterium]
MTAPPVRRPRLLWVNHFAVTRDMGGGTRHVELGRELTLRGWDVTLAASDFHLHHREYMRRTGATDRAPVRETVDAVHIEWLWAAPYERNDLRRVWNWLSFGRSLLADDLRGEAPDVVIGSTPHLFAAEAARRLARRHAVPFILEVRDLWPESLAVGGRIHGPGYWSLWMLARALYRSAHHIIVLARGVEEHLRRIGVAASRITVVPNGVDVSAYNGTRSPPRDRLRLVYAGAHGPANGLDTVLDAAKLLRDEPRVSFLFIGDGPSKEALRQRARNLGLERVEFAEPVSKSGMPRVLADCDAGLMVLKDVPLFSYGVSPNKLFDYWGAALPVLNNVPGEVAGWVRSAAGGIQAAATADALADGIRRLLAVPPDERRAMGERGRAWVEREHDRPVLAARLDAALRPFLPGSLR